MLRNNTLSCITENSDKFATDAQNTIVDIFIQISEKMGDTTVTYKRFYQTVMFNHVGKISNPLTI